MTSNTDCGRFSIPRKAPPLRKDLAVVRSNGASFDRLETETGYAVVWTGVGAFLNDAVLNSDASLPVPFHDRRRGSAAIEPLKRLKMAVLVAAIRCYRRNLDAVKLRKRREFREVLLRPRHRS